MTFNAQGELMDDVAAATTPDFTITWTTNAPSASTAATVANGSAVTSAEVGAILFNHNAQIAALKVDMAAIRTVVNA
jgi:hypothetical protein